MGNPDFGKVEEKCHQIPTIVSQLIDLIKVITICFITRKFCQYLLKCAKSKFRMLVTTEKGKLESPLKNLNSKDDRNRNRTYCTAVEGECSDHCIILIPPLSTTVIQEEARVNSSVCLFSLTTYTKYIMGIPLNPSL